MNHQKNNLIISFECTIQDETAFHCKMVNLLQLGKFKEALHQMETQSGLADMVDLTFEKAYCLYKENKYQEALTVLDSSRSSNGLKHKELRAQLFYRYYVLMSRINSLKK